MATRLSHRPSYLSNLSAHLADVAVADAALRCAALCCNAGRLRAKRDQLAIASHSLTLSEDNNNQAYQRKPADTDTMRSGAQPEVAASANKEPEDGKQQQRQASQRRRPERAARKQQELRGQVERQIQEQRQQQPVGVEPVNLSEEMRDRLAGLARRDSALAATRTPEATATAALASRAALEAAAMQQFANLRNLSAVASALQQHQQQLLSAASAAAATAASGNSTQQPPHLGNLGQHLSRPAANYLAAHQLANNQHTSNHLHHLQHQQHHLAGHQISPNHHLHLLKRAPNTEMGARRGRGRELRKCRKVYGMERRSLWCTQCKWKKACSRFCDRGGGGAAAQLSPAFR